MGLTATTLDDWEFVSMDPELRLEKEDQTDGTLKFYKRVHFRFQRRRKFLGFLSFDEDVGDTQTTLSAYVSANTLWSYVSSRTWMLTVDRPEIFDQICGAGEQVQTWEHITQREEIDVDDVFSGTNP
jgi:hypothetical protein